MRFESNVFCLSIECLELLLLWRHNSEWENNSEWEKDSSKVRRKRRRGAAATKVGENRRKSLFLFSVIPRFVSLGPREKERERERERESVRWLRFPHALSLFFPLLPLAGLFLFSLDAHLSSLSLSLSLSSHMGQQLGTYFFFLSLGRRKKKRKKDKEERESNWEKNHATFWRRRRRRQRRKKESEGKQQEVGFRASSVRWIKTTSTVCPASFSVSFSSDQTLKGRAGERASEQQKAARRTKWEKESTSWVCCRSLARSSSPWRCAIEPRRRQKRQRWNDRYFPSLALGPLSIIKRSFRKERKKKERKRMRTKKTLCVRLLASAQYTPSLARFLVGSVARRPCTE